MKPQQPLINKSIGAAFWSVGGGVMRVVLQLGTQILLARILGPEVYGVFAIGILVITFSAYFSDIGLAYGLIKSKEINSVDVRFIFTWQMLFGLLVSGLVFACAPLVATVFQEPRSELVVKFLSVVCLINAIQAPSLNILKREMRQKEIQVGQILAYFVGYVLIGLPVAMLGGGVWSLVCGWIALSLVQLVILYFLVRHPIAPIFWYEGAKDFFQFGSIVLATNLINWFMSSVDKVVAGRAFPGGALGLYSNSFTLLNTPTTIIYSSLQSVTFAAASRVQGDIDSLRRAYVKLFGLIFGLFLPIFVCVAVVSETVILSLYGEAWIGASQYLSAFSLGMPMLLIWGISTPILWNTGRASQELFIQAPVAIIWFFAALIAVSYSLEHLSWALVTCFLVRAMLIVLLVCRSLKISIKEIFEIMAGPIITALSIGYVLYIFDRKLNSENLSNIVTLGADAMLAASSLIAAICFFRGALSQHARSLLLSASERLPERLRYSCSKIARGPK